MTNNNITRFGDAVAEWTSITAPPPPPLKPVILDPAHTALFVLDFNRNNCVESIRPRCAAVLPNVRSLLKSARAGDMPVVICHTHHMTDEDYFDDLKPQDGDITFGGEEDKFFGRDLDTVLKARRVETILMTGVSANSAVMVTCIGAALRGFRIVVPVDAIAAATAYQEQFAIWQLANAPLFRNDGVVTLTRTHLVSFGA